MKKIKKLLVLIALSFAVIASGTASANTVTLEDFLSSYFDHIGKDIPDSYQYIELYFDGIEKGTDIYTNLQKAVYLDMVENNKIAINPQISVKQENIANMIDVHFGYKPEHQENTIADDIFLEKVISELPSYKNYYCGNTQYITVDLSEYEIVNNEKFPILNDVYNKLNEEFYANGQLDQTKLLYGAIKGLAESVEDPYTVFFPPVDSEEYFAYFEGEYEGIGAMIEKVEEGIKVVSPFEDSPAEKAGIKPGDIITEVDGTSIVDMSDLEAVGFIKGPAGTSVSLTILREGQTLQIPVMREAITIDYVHTEEIDSETFYIDVDAFANDTTEHFETAIQEFNQTTASRLIIDLRNNPGGLLNVANELVSFFLPQGSDSFTLKTNQSSIPYKTEATTVTARDTKIYILINEGSASASEIFSQVLRDHGIAILVGTQSFGKGSGQAVYDYKTGESFKFTNFKWYSTKTMESIDLIGLEPDYLVEDDEDTEKDEQLDYLKNMQ